MLLLSLSFLPSCGGTPKYLLMIPIELRELTDEIRIFIYKPEITNTDKRKRSIYTRVSKNIDEVFSYKLYANEKLEQNIYERMKSKSPYVPFSSIDLYSNNVRIFTLECYNRWYFNFNNTEYYSRFFGESYFTEAFDYDDTLRAGWNFRDLT